MFSLLLAKEEGTQHIFLNYCGVGFFLVNFEITRHFLFFQPLRIPLSESDFKDVLICQKAILPIM